MANIQFRISKRSSGDRSEVLVRFWSGTFAQRAKTRVFCPVSAWNDTDGQVIIPKKITHDTAELMEVQRKLDQVRECVYARWVREQYDARDGWLQQVIDDCFNVVRVQARRVSDIVRECAKYKVIEKRSLDQYEVLANAMERFEVRYRNVYIDTFSKKDVENFVEFFKSEKRTLKSGEVVDVNRSRNTITSKLKKLSAVCNYAVARGYMTVSPFSPGQYKIKPEVYGTPVFLKLQERDQLFGFSELPPRLAVQRDIFIFQCHVGCRVSDLMSFTKENVTEDGFLQYIPHKTRKDLPTAIRVPLSETAKTIVKRYELVTKYNRLLPFENSVQYNEDIHKILRLAGIDRVVMVQDPLTLEPVPKHLWEVASSHLARRTFMANMFKETKSERITSSFTGHVDGSQAFKRYVDVDDEMKQEIIEKMNRDGK